MRSSLVLLALAVGLGGCDWQTQCWKDAKGILYVRGRLDSGFYERCNAMIEKEHLIKVYSDE